MGGVSGKTSGGEPGCIAAPPELGVSSGVVLGSPVCAADSRPGLVPPARPPARPATLRRRRRPAHAGRPRAGGHHPDRALPLHALCGAQRHARPAGAADGPPPRQRRLQRRRNADLLLRCLGPIAGGWCVFCCGSVSPRQAAPPNPCMGSLMLHLLCSHPVSPLIDAVRSWSRIWDRSSASSVAAAAPFSSLACPGPCCFNMRTASTWRPRSSSRSRRGCNRCWRAVAAAHVPWAQAAATTTWPASCGGRGVAFWGWLLACWHSLCSRSPRLLRRRQRDPAGGGVTQNHLI